MYWIALFAPQERRGFTVLLVNARDVKNVSGRNSDVLSCQWLQQLMTYGLLHGAFRPAEAVCVLVGGKVMSGKTKRVANRAAQALRLAAAALRSSKSPLGAYFRRMCARTDSPKAIAAAAHKLARLIYTMLTKGEEHTDRNQDYFEQRYRERVLHNLSRRANEMGMRLVAVEQPA